MDFASILGILSGLSLIVAAIFLKGDLTNFYNVAGLMIYADLITPVLVFFILLFSISRINMERMIQRLKSMEVDFLPETSKTHLFDLIETWRSIENTHSG